MTVHQEIIDRFMSDPYLDPADDAVIDNLISVMREQGMDPEALGLDRDELRRRLVLSREANDAPSELRELPVQPQTQRKVLRQQLRETTQSAASRICESLGEAPTGVRIALLGGAPGQNNLGAVIARMHRAVNERLEIDSGARRELTLEQIATVLPLLDEIADGVERQLTESLTRG